MATHADKAEGVHLEYSNTPAIDDNHTLQKVDTADTVHNDEAVTVLAHYDGDQEWTKDEEKRLVRKIDRRLLVILTLSFGIQFYDKYMLSHAAIFGLITDLDLVGNRYSMASSIFYLGYIAGAYPASLLAQRLSIHRVIFTLIFIWGLCVMATALCTTYRGLYAQRFFLGFLESGVSPTWMVVVGSWYTKEEQTLRQGVWFSAAALFAIPAPLINYGLGHINGSLSPWQYMYIVAGSITVLWSFVVLLFMEPDPVHAKRLTEREKFIAVSRVRVNNSGVRNTHFKTKQLWEVLSSAQFWLLVGVATFMVTINTINTVFLPIIIRGMGFSGLNALLLTVPVGVIGTILTLGPCWAMQLLSKHNLRTYTIAFLGGCMILASCLLWQKPNMNNGTKLFCLYLSNVFPGAYALLMNLAIMNAAGYTKRTLTSAGLFVGYCIGNFVTPFTFLTSQSPHYDTGFTFVAICLAVMVVFVLSYRILCIWTNKKRDAAGFEENFEHAYEDDVTDKMNPHFRYVY